MDGYQVSPLVVDHAGKVWFGDPNTGLLIYDRGQTTVVSHNTELEGYYITDLTVMPEGVVRVEAVRPSAEGLAVAVFDCDGKRVMRVRED